MKTVLFITLLFLSDISAQQYYYTFSELKGMEDGNNDTHLFYRTYTLKEAGYPFSNYYENSIHHFDIQNNVDTLFLWDGQDYSYNTTRILDLKFWDNNPSKYIYCGFHAVLDPTAFIQRYDESASSFYGLGTVENLEIQNDSIMFATTTTNEATYTRNILNMKDGQIIIVTDIDAGGKTTPEKYLLFQNYPNPFNPTTTIKYDLPKESMVQLIIYNILGEKVAELVNTFQKPGSYNVEWNANKFASGVYIYWIKAGDFISARKLILLK